MKLRLLLAWLKVRRLSPRRLYWRYQAWQARRRAAARWAAMSPLERHIKTQLWEALAREEDAQILWGTGTPPDGPTGIAP